MTLEADQTSTGNPSYKELNIFFGIQLLLKFPTSRTTFFFIEDKKELTHSALTKCQVENEILQKRPVNVAQNTTNFLHQTSNETLKTLGVRDRFAIIISAKKFMKKNKLMNEVKAKAKQSGE